MRSITISPIWSVVFAGDTIAAIAAAVGVLTTLLVQQYTAPDPQAPIGRNYTTADTN